MGILPLEFTNGENAESLGLNGHESYTLDVNPETIHVFKILIYKVNQKVHVIAKSKEGEK